MSVTSGFFDSRDHDRQYNAEEISRLFDGLINDGIFRNYADGLKVEATEISEGDNMSVVVKSGRCWFNHTWMLNTEDYYINDIIQNATEVNRIDAVVVDVDFTDDVREVSIKYIRGQVNGKFPTLIRESYHCQYPLAYITVKPNATVITENDISDRRGKTTIERGTESDPNTEYGTPWAVIMLGNAGLKTNLPGITMEGFQFETEDKITTENMVPNLFYGVAEEMK